jgi:hypothetical protein
VCCFFDPDLIAKRNPYSTNRRSPLSPEELNRIGWPIKNASLPQFWIYVSLALFFLIETLAACYDCCSARSPRHDFAKRQTERRRNGFPFMKVLRFLILFVCPVIDIFCAWHINSLRKRVSQSGWMRNNSENEWFSIGQLMPVFSLSSILFTLLESINIHGESLKSLEAFNL